MTETIDCKRFLPLLEDFVDGEVTGESLSELQAHLRECPACFGRVEVARSMQGLVRAATPPMVTPELLRRRIQKEFKVVSPWRRRMQQPWVRPALAAACLLLLIAGVSMLFPRSTPADWSVAMVNDHTMCWMAETGPPAKIKDVDGTLTKFLQGTKPGVPAVRDTKFQNLKPCPVQGAVASAHMFFKRPGDVQLSMYFAKQDGWAKELPDSPDKARIDAVEHDGKTYQVATWQHDGVVTGLVASTSREYMQDLTRSTRYSGSQALLPSDAVLVSLHAH